GARGLPVLLLHHRHSHSLLLSTCQPIRDVVLSLSSSDRGDVMGEEISGTSFDRADHARYRAKVRRCLDALETMLDAGVFLEDEWRTGLEIELDLVDAEMRPFHGNTAVLERIADPLYQ